VRHNIPVNTVVVSSDVNGICVVIPVDQVAFDFVVGAPEVEPIATRVSAIAPSSPF